MQNGLEVSTDFINEVVLPLLREGLSEDIEKVAVAIIGTGSDVLGLDDEISRDHHWGPRANVMFLKKDAADLRPRIVSILNRCPAKFREFNVAVDIENMTGLCSSEVESYFATTLGDHQFPPQADVDWLQLCEVDLFSVTKGRVVFDGPGVLTRLRRELSYYPESVWKKRIADWCMYLSGRDSPYNFHRVSRRGDDLTGRIYMAMFTKRAMEFCFILNKQYAPYTKWLSKLMRNLPRFGHDVSVMLDELIELTDARAKVMKQVEINYYFADKLAELGLTGQPQRQPFDEGLTDLTLYYSAAEIYRTLPVEYLDLSFNNIEYWEPLARKTILDPGDFVQKKKDSQAESSTSN